MIGETIARYKIVEQLGQGSMGVVYRAEDQRLHRSVALKIMPSNPGDSAEGKRRFILEARAASAIRHPNICTVFDIGETDSNLMYIVMPLYDGQSLDGRLQSGHIPAGEMLSISDQLVSGLSEAHRLGIIHRDIKPANIFLTGDGALKILDFGLARIMGSTRLTRTGTSMGTIAYCSPEQMLGRETDARTDIWSLGVVLYEIVTGRLPFQGEHEEAIIYSVLNEEPRTFITGKGTMLEMLNRLILKTLEKDPGNRYPGMPDLRRDFELFKKRALG